MPETLLDASAIIAVIRREPGGDIVADVEFPVASSVNIAEAATSLTNKGFGIDQAIALVTALRLTIIDFDSDQAFEAARLRPLTRDFGLSLGDRACLAVARLRDLPVLTSDRIWSEAVPDLKITQIR